MGSGNRKTSVINSLSAPLVRWEKLERDRRLMISGRLHASEIKGGKA